MDYRNPNLPSNRNPNLRFPESEFKICVTRLARQERVFLCPKMAITPDYWRETSYHLLAEQWS
jgi:hypothetical protein